MLERKRDLTPIVALAFGTGLIYLAFMAPGIYSPDGRTTFYVARSLLIEHSFEVPPHSALSVPGRHGLYYSMCWPLLSLVAVPFVGAGLVAAHLFHIPDKTIEPFFALFLSPMLTATSVYLTALLAVRLGASTRGALIAAMGFAFGTVAMVYTRDFFSEPLLSLLTVWAIYLQLGQRAKMVGLVTGLAILAKPTGVILAPLLAIHAALKKRSWSAAWSPLCGAGIGISLYCVYNYVRFGSVITFGQSNKFVITHFPIGFAGLLISPGRGLIWYCPVVLALAGLDKRILRQPDSFLIFAIAAGYLLEYSFWKVWYGGWSWGPRLLMPALPGLLALTGLLDKKWLKVVIALTVTGFLVTAPNLVSCYYNFFHEQILSGESPESRGSLWSPSRAPLIRIWGVCYRDLREAPSLNSREPTRGIGTWSHTSASPGPYRIFGIWWWKLPVMAVAPWIGLTISAIILTAGIALICWVCVMKIPSEAKLERVR